MSSVRKIKQAQLKHVRQEMLDKQSGRCAICTIHISNEDAVQDHDHSSGFLREVLCRNCNGLEGKIKNLCNRGKRKWDHAWYISRIMQYWEKHDDNVPEHGLIYPTHKNAEEKRLLANKKARQRYAKLKDK